MSFESIKQLLGWSNNGLVIPEEEFPKRRGQRAFVVENSPWVKQDSTTEDSIPVGSMTLPSRPHDPRKIFTIVTATIVIALIGAVIGAYFGDHSGAARNFFNGEISVGKGLLTIAVPIVGAGLLTAFVFYVYANHKHERKVHQGDSCIERPNAPTLLDSFKKLAPSKRQKIVIGVGLAIIVIVGLIATVVLVKHPAYSQWMQNAMGHPIKLWEALAYMGGSTLAIMVAANLAFHFYQKRSHEKESESVFDMPY